MAKAVKAVKKTVKTAKGSTAAASSDAKAVVAPATVGSAATAAPAKKVVAKKASPQKAVAKKPAAKKASAQKAAKPKSTTGAVTGKLAPAVAPSALNIDIGISSTDRAAVALELSKVLADSYTVYLMTHNFHWNVTGPMFKTLHELFMTQYTELWQALDDIAERIRALGHYAPGTYAEFEKLASIKQPTKVPSASEMLELLVKGNEALARVARTAFDRADKADDQPTADLLTQRLDVHEKNAWMLRSLLAV